jgi:diacylglycerol kinase family enzyme
VRVLTGMPRYLAAVFSTLLRYRACEASVRADGEAWQVALFLAAIGNGTTSGGGFMLTPGALPDDGMLDLCCVRDLPLHRILRVLPKTFSGGHTREPEVRLARAARIRLELAAPQAVHLDGEVLSERVAEIDVAIASERQTVVVKL